MQNSLANKNSSRNASIDIFRLVCAVMVVAIHTHPFEDLSSPLHLIFSVILPRIAVPFFLCTSGYFYIRKLIRGDKVFIPYIKRIITIYFSWSIIYILIDFFRKVVPHKEEAAVFLQKLPSDFFIKGSEYHFWYFPALIISVCIVTLFYKLKIFKALLPLSLALYGVGCLGCSYYSIGKNIPFLSDLYNYSDFTTIRRIFFTALPFFMCGYFVYLIKKLPLKNKVLIPIFVSGFLMFFAEIILLDYFRIQREIVITVFLYILLVFVMLLLLNNPLPQFGKFSEKSKVIADFTYYFHPLVIIFIKYIYWKFPKCEPSQTFLFILTVAVSFGLGFLCTKLKKDNIIKKIFF